MIKKRLVTLGLALSLATTSFSGVLSEPVVAEASDTKTITITKDDCISGVEVNNMLEENRMFFESSLDEEFNPDNLFGGAYTVWIGQQQDENSIWYLYIPAYDKFYKLGKPVLDRKITVKYKLGDDEEDDDDCEIDVETKRFEDGNNYYWINCYITRHENMTNKKKFEDLKKGVKNLVVHKPVKIPSVKLSASEKKGIITVKTGNLKEAAKFHKMLKRRKVVKVKVKASKEKIAEKIYKKLNTNLGYVNTYGFSTVRTWSDFFRKEKSYYIMDHKSTSAGIHGYVALRCDSDDYYYGLKVFKRVWGIYKDNFKYYNCPLPNNVHFCDLSEVARAYPIPFIDSRVHNYDYKLYALYNGGCSQKEFNSYKKKHPEENPSEKLSTWQILAGNKKYTDFVCAHFASTDSKIGRSLGLNVEVISGYINGEPHVWTKFKIKNSNNKITYFESSNGEWTISSEKRYDKVDMPLLRDNFNLDFELSQLK